MEFLAQLKLKGEQDAGNLVRAFFTEFSSESSIFIKGNEAKLNIIFDAPPLKIIDAICSCEIVACNYGKTVQENFSDLNFCPLNNGEKTPSETRKEKIADKETSRTKKAKVEANLESNTKQMANADKKMLDNQIEVGDSENDSIKQTATEFEHVEISQLAQIAKASASFDNFINSVSDWLGFGKRHMFFVCLVYAACESKKVSWKGIKKVFEDNGWRFNEYEKIVSSKIIADKFADSGITILQFVKAIVSYKDYAFNNDSVKAVKDSGKELPSHLEDEQKENNLELSETKLQEEEIIVAAETKSQEEEIIVPAETELQEEEIIVPAEIELQEEKIPVPPVEEVKVEKKLEHMRKIPVIEAFEVPPEEINQAGSFKQKNLSSDKAKMNCMPSIPYFEEVLGQVDKTQTVEERVIHVLNAMGLEDKTDKEQQFIFSIVNTAVRQKRIAFDIIFLKAYIDMKDSQKAKMILSGFINDFVKRNGSSEKIKVLTFLKDLQKIIMYQDELEDFENFGEGF